MTSSGLGLLAEAAADGVLVRAPAKINLCLGVGSVRDDGFHPLATVYQAIGLFDDVRVRPADRTTISVSTEGIDISEVPIDDSNLAVRAAMLLARHHKLDEAVDIHIHKRIPVAGGLAGGSTDAAATLVACDLLWGTSTPREVLVELAAELGSDVPFCIGGGTVMGGGRGELLTSVMTRGRFWWVVLPDAGGLSTPQVYGEFDRLTSGSVPEPEVSDELLAALRSGDPALLAPALSNDLQAAALSLRPDLGERLDHGLDSGALAAQVTGSGPTTVYLCESFDHAEEIAEALQDFAGPNGVFVAEGPVHGVREISR